MTSDSLSPIFTHALFLAEHETASPIDKSTLRHLGRGRVRSVNSGRDALALLAAMAEGGDAALPVDMILCQERLSDMTGIDFLCQLRNLPHSASLPVVFLVSSDESPLARAAALSRSCSLLVRPYTQNEACKALAAARLPENMRAPLPLPEQLIPRGGGFSTRGPAVRAPMVPGAVPGAVHGATRGVGRSRSSTSPCVVQAVNSSSAMVVDSAPHDNEAALAGAYERDPAQAEACLSLSRMALQKCRDHEARLWLCRAGVALLRRNENTRAQGLFSRLRQAGVTSALLVAEAGVLLQQQETILAAKVFLEAKKLDPAQALHTMVSRACMFTRAPESSLVNVCRAMEKLGHASTARQLENRLLSDDVPEYEPQISEFWRRHPRLHDLVSVASLTFFAWRRAA